MFPKLLQLNNIKHLATETFCFRLFRKQINVSVMVYNPLWLWLSEVAQILGKNVSAT
jgi:hypothetical protein